jgi:4-aminobutyrate aminotransferase-like enzyme/Ser/Thr protein kinase RdoA (MazF antagonist)
VVRLEQLQTLDSPPPTFTVSQAEATVADVFGIRGAATQLVSERDQNFLIEPSGSGSGFVLKISNPMEDPGFVDMQTMAMLHVAATDPSLPVAQPCRSRDGEYHPMVAGPDGRSQILRLLTFMPGGHLEATSLELDAIRTVTATSARLGRALHGFFHPAARHGLAWLAQNFPHLRPLVRHIQDEARRSVVEHVLDRFEDQVQPVFERLRAQVIHNDLTLDNSVVDERFEVSGILDFGDMGHSALVCDLVSSADSLMSGRPDLFEALAASIAGFELITPLEHLEKDVLGNLLLARAATAVILSAFRADRYPGSAGYITGWDPGAWALLMRFDGLGDASFDRNVREAINAAAGDVPLRELSEPIEELIRGRRRLLGSALLPLTYDRPLHLVRGEGSWLFDAEGRAYLDCYNNVPVVGHSHPTVVEAISRQARALNTNTRYLHRSALELAERLIATMPVGLDTVMFVNSGSEANDLAWRLATTVTGGSGAIVTEYAYHGVTAATSDFSPEEWPAGHRPDHVGTVPAPDAYSGEYRGQEGWLQRSAAYIDDAIASLAQRGHQPAAMFIDPAFTSDGIFVPPPEYLEGSVERWRRGGGLLVADEVQTGFGRPGSHLWGFEISGVVPDVVTLGKPMGNGHPVAAVVTRADIVDRFARENQWFSTFGGNPVACEAALAVLEVIERDDLLDHALATAIQLGAEFARLAERHDLIGDVRSMGLLIGIELVEERQTRAPAAEVTRAVMNEMRDRGVLVGTTGPHGSVLKIRPPLVISSSEMRTLVGTLDEALRAISEKDPRRDTQSAST